MPSTSTLLVAASNLVNNVGLAPNVAMLTLGSTITSQPVVSSYANVQPGTTNGNILAANSLSVRSLNLPVFVANANTAVTSIQSQCSKVFPDFVTFASLLLSAESFVLYSDKAYKSMSSFSDKSFDNLGINVDSHQSAVTNGIASLFGGGATAPADIKNNISKLSTALGNLGSLYDTSKLTKLGDPTTFVQHLLNSGYNFVPPDGWQSMTASELKYYLDGIVGPVFTRVMDLSGFTPPKSASITSLGDLLDLSKVFPDDALALVPGRNFSGLANMFVNLGGKFKSMTDVSTLLNGIDVPTLEHLSSYTSPVTSSDITNLTSKLGAGSGTNNNPTIIDVLGTVAGIPHVAGLTTVSAALSSIASRSTTTTLVTKLNDLSTACATEDSGQIATAFAALQTAANAFKADSVVVSLAAANTAIVNSESQITTENNNIAVSGINIAAGAGSGVAGIMALVNNLHDYGVDVNNLKFNELFAGMVQQNVGGDAVLASLSEGKNINIQAQFSVPIGTKSS
jgi:hypothetical protein